MSEKAVRIIQK